MALTEEHKAKLRARSNAYWADPEHRARARELALAGAKKRKPITVERDELRSQVEQLTAERDQLRREVERLRGER